MIEDAIQPFIIGLGVGLIICIFIYMRESFKRSVLKKQIKDLKNHLHQKMEIDAEATHFKKTEIEDLKKENENLRITNQTLSQKPGRRELINLHVYQRAIDIMSESAHGFAPMWQKAVKESEKDIEQFVEGKSSFVKKIISPISFFSNSSGIETKNIGTGDTDDTSKE
ncbi:MAG: LapA family protein [Flammeovirgaceae bacterium]|nr:LapA family protein [Flammeovirgaceae bacterium]